MTGPPRGAAELIAELARLDPAGRAFLLRWLAIAHQGEAWNGLGQLARSRAAGCPAGDPSPPPDTAPVWPASWPPRRDPGPGDPSPRYPLPWHPVADYVAPAPPLIVTEPGPLGAAGEAFLPTIPATSASFGDDGSVTFTDPDGTARRLEAGEEDS